MPSDIQHEHPLFARTPPAIHPYIKIARMDRPIGTWLLLLPCLWSIVLAENGLLSMDSNAWRHVALFSLGAFLMRSAGCVINDLWDMKLDSQVERTKTRPLPAGEITPKQALAFLAVLLGLSLCILFTLTKLAIILGFSSLVLVAAYPLMKRITWWPQAFLGLTFNWGALMGWAAMTGKPALAPLFLYIGGVFWTLAYDTIYAHQDKEDDAQVNIKSTALLFGDRSRKYIGGFFIAAILCIIIAKYMVFPSVMTLLFLLPVSLHAYRQTTQWDMHDPDSCLAMFKSNRNFGLLILLMLAL